MPSEISWAGINLLTSAIIVFRRIIYLIFTPYKTMRKIAVEKDYGQVIVVMAMVFVYFILSSLYKERSIAYYTVFLLHFCFTVFFFYSLSRMSRKDIDLGSFISVFTYSLVPTLVWFIANLIFYIFLPPPRTLSLLGKTFSLFFVAFSISIFLWKGILTFLALRFAGKLHFYRIMYYMLLYGIYLLFYSIIMYKLGISRIPFV